MTTQPCQCLGDYRPAVAMMAKDLPSGPPRRRANWSQPACAFRAAKDIDRERWQRLPAPSQRLWHQAVSTE